MLDAEDMKWLGEKFDAQRDHNSKEFGKLYDKIDDNKDELQVTRGYVMAQDATIQNLANDLNGHLQAGIGDNPNSPEMVNHLKDGHSFGAACKTLGKVAGLLTAIGTIFGIVYIVFT